MNTHTPVVLIIRDGWGSNHDSGQDAYNAVKLANIPFSRELSTHWPRTELIACGLDVGLPAGVMGNSEVGHQNIGAGRIVDQEIVRIDKALASGELLNNPLLQEGFNNAKRPGHALHFMGLVSDAGVHSTLEHLYGLWRMAIDAGVERIFIHALTDGRDTPPKSGSAFIKAIESRAREWGTGRIATVCGRYWAMDRDKRWDRVRMAYDCLVGRGELRLAPSAAEAVEAYYQNPMDATRAGDEFILPTAVCGVDGKPIGRIQEEDTVVFFNFRGDRPREITRAFIEPNFTEFDRGPYLNPFYITLTEYEAGLCPRVLFMKPEKMKGILGQVVSQAGLKQFRVAETEKYPHVTFFFNDYRNEAFPGEDWKLVQSPKDVPTYDLKPRMSAEGVAAAARDAILSKQYALVVVNFANADMVGHTGSLPAAIAACEAVDEGVHTIVDAIHTVGGAALITADHGNADQMWDPQTHGPHTRHTLNPVELIVYGRGLEHLRLRSGGRLADIAPTILQLMGLKKPSEMTGTSLIVP